MTTTNILDLDLDAYLYRNRSLTDEELIPGETVMAEVGEVSPPLVTCLAETGLVGSASLITNRLSCSDIPAETIRSTPGRSPSLAFMRLTPDSISSGVRPVHPQVPTPTARGAAIATSIAVPNPRPDIYTPVRREQVPLIEPNRRPGNKTSS